MIPPFSDLNQKTAAPLPKNGSAGATTGTTKALNAEVSQLLAGDNGTPRNWRGPLLVLPAIYALVGLVLRSGNADAVAQIKANAAQHAADLRGIVDNI
jgi:hypothetical protein